MNRRRFLCWLTGSIAAGAGVAILAKRVGWRRSTANAGSDWRVALYDPEFAGYAAGAGRSIGTLSRALVDKGVLSEDGALDVAAVGRLARDDAIVVYENFSYTETELQLYGLAYLLGRASH